MRYLGGDAGEDLPAGPVILVFFQAIDQARGQGVEFEKPYLVLPIAVNKQADGLRRFFLRQVVGCNSVHRVVISQGPGQIIENRNV